VSATASDASQLGIVELVDVCARERARSLALFERTGEWVVSTTDPGLQRFFATASHRHAWHAELWADRTPTIPVAPTAGHDSWIAEATDDAGRGAAHASALDALLTDLAAIRERVDRDLDPSTVRVLDLVCADVSELAATSAQSRPR